MALLQSRTQNVVELATIANARGLLWGAEAVTKFLEQVATFGSTLILLQQQEAGFPRSACAPHATNPTTAQQVSSLGASLPPVLDAPMAPVVSPPPLYGKGSGAHPQAAPLLSAAAVAGVVAVDDERRMTRKRQRGRGGRGGPW